MFSSGLRPSRAPVSQVAFKRKRRPKEGSAHCRQMLEARFPMAKAQVSTHTQHGIEAQVIMMYQFVYLAFYAPILPDNNLCMWAIQQLWNPEYILEFETSGTESGWYRE